MAHIPPESQVDVVKIELIDIASTWWKSKEAQLERSIIWKIFSDRFYARFYPLIAQDDIEWKFIELRQEGGNFDAYATSIRDLANLLLI